MQPNSINKNHTTSIISSFICFLILVVMLGCSKKNKEEEKYITPITHAMIDIVEMQSEIGAPFLANVLKKLQAGESIDIDAKNADNDDYTALHYAAQFGIPSVIQALIDRKADVNAKTKNVEFTPLMLAVQKNKPSAITTILASDATDINAGLKIPGNVDNGITTLHLASYYGHKEVVKLLVADNRLEINKKTADGTTALTIAIFGGKTEIVKLLKEKGAV